ncbi:MAG: ATP-binding cassette domain-containing protein [Candidatus Marinimicrobia bacterium]|nr:ATP-binding cassette domain-containing protein [Candidatus Neomarinimicrobiota bacterium]
MSEPGTNGDLVLTDLRKAFNGTQAVDGISLNIKPGSITGLLGPNGAGKTTTIRIVMGILGADSGTVAYCGKPVTRRVSRKFGYLPEERGLYQKAHLRESLIYLGRLKGLTKVYATQQANHYLEVFDLGPFATKPVRNLSKGNQQKVQFIAAIIHSPDLLILDEPFAGLDPVNQILLKDIIRQEQARGVAVLFSTHQMEQVEQLCDQICLIDRGKVVLSGALAEIKADHGEQLVEVAFESDLPQGLENIIAIVDSNETTVIGHARKSLAETLKELTSLGPVISFKVKEPTLEHIFIDIVGRKLE